MELSLAEARRLALSAQGFGRRPAKPTLAHVRKVASTVLAVQLDSVNVLVRSHYLPAYSRLGRTSGSRSTGSRTGAGSCSSAGVTRVVYCRSGYIR